MKMNEITRTAALASDTKGYETFVTRMATMPVGISVSVEAVLGDEWTTLDRSEKIKLGKAIMPNVKNGNLAGIQADEFIPGKAQTYRRIGDVEMKTIFSVPLWAEVDDMQQVLEMNPNLASNWIYAKCFWNEEENFICKFVDGAGTEIASYERTIGEKFFKKHENSGTNAEFKAIIALWYGFDRVFENREYLSDRGIDSVCFVAPNAQMMARIAANKFDTSANSYDYTEFIQKQFADFKEAGIRELPFKCGIYAMHNAELKK